MSLRAAGLPGGEWSDRLGRLPALAVALTWRGLLLTFTEPNLGFSVGDRG